SAFNMRMLSERRNAAINEMTLTNLASGISTPLVSQPTANNEQGSACEDINGNKFIAFVSDRDGNREIYLTDASGVVQTNLTNNAAEDIEPSLSPDCAKIAFVTDRDGNREIYTMNRDGTGVFRLTNDPAEDRQPDWSPDSATIVFSTNRLGRYQVFIEAAAGGPALQLTDEPGENRNPSWRKFAGLIAFGHCTGAGPAFTPCQIGILGYPAGTITYINNGVDSHEQPEWLVATAGDRYLLISRLASGAAQYHIFLMTPEGYIIRQVSPDALDDRSPSCCLSP
ncbi:MAG: TolB family protein, partial [Burkholderiales bacterium]